MRQRIQLFGTLTMGGLAMLALLLISGQGALSCPAAPSAQGVASGQITSSVPFTSYLPIVARWYDFSYVNPVGIAMYGTVNESTGLDVMQTAGSQWVATMFHWSAVEPSPGTYNWSSFDVKAQNAQAAEMELLVLFTSNPSWAAHYSGGPVYNIQDLVNITQKAAERYDCDGVDDAPGSPCVHYWSFYAEPDNNSSFYADRGWGYWGNNGAGYADMLYHVSPAMRAANPRVKVAIGGLAFDAFDPPGHFVYSFLGDTLQALSSYPGGIRRYLDAVGFHFYPISPDRWPTIREKANEVRGIMAQHGVGDLLLTCPEAGYWSSPKFDSSEQKQAERLAQMYVRSLSVGVRPVIWYKIYDVAWAGSAEDLYPDRTAGLLRPDGSQKPAYLAYQAVARELGRSYYSRRFQHSGIEGYVFQVAANREMTVLWGTTTAVNVSFPYTCLRRVYLLGGDEEVPDGSSWDLDGATNGRITVRINQNQASYIEPCH